MGHRSYRWWLCGFIVRTFLAVLVVAVVVLLVLELVVW